MFQDAWKLNEMSQHFCGSVGDWARVLLKLIDRLNMWVQSNEKKNNFVIANICMSE